MTPTWCDILMLAIGFLAGGAFGRFMAARVVRKWKQERTANDCLAAHVGKLETLRKEGH